MRRVIIVQARTTSSRLPGKVLQDICGRPMLGRILDRLKLCQASDDIVVATSTNSSDDPVADVAHSCGVGCFRGSENDVLGRFTGAAAFARAELVCRITADCPLIDSGETDRVILELAGNSSRADYCSNVLHRTFPRGLDTEALFIDVLIRMNRLALSAPSREHVTVFIRSERPDLFLTRSVMDTENNEHLRWTVDLPSDLELIRQIYKLMGLADRAVPYREVLAFVKANPSLTSLNTANKTWTP